MSRASRTPKPVESFGPEILQALIEGSRREIVLSLPYRKAVFFRSRVNALRAEMRRQNHELYRIVSQATIRVIWGKEAGFDEVPESKSSTNVRFPTNKNVPAQLVITPADREFSEALKRAGVEVKPIALDSGPNTGTTEPVEDILANYLRGEEPNATT